jgi:hypothetical protein
MSRDHAARNTTFVNAGVKLQQLAGVKMHQWQALAHRSGSLAARMAELLGRAERSSPVAA